MSVTPDQQQQIRAFVENGAMMEAVREVLFSGISEEGLKRYMLSLDRELPNEQYGALLKARAEAAHIIEASFAQLRQVASGARGVQSQQNGAR